MRFFKRSWRPALILVIALSITVYSLSFKAYADAGRALVVAVDVSSSVDAESYKLQMEGIAAALENEDVFASIMSTSAEGILFTMVTWANHPRTVISWTKIDSIEKARITAARIRKLPQIGGQYTCVTRMFRHIIDKVLPQMPGRAFQTVVDVSGDGKENCNPHNPVTMTRDELVGQNVTINGLPILQGGEGDTIEKWYRENVIGGFGAFVVTANGFKDFGSAFIQKFRSEITGLPLPREYADKKAD